MARYIDADKLLPKIKYREKTYGLVSNMFSKVVKEMPAADVQEIRHGQWLQVSDDDQYEGSYLCSECRTEETFFDESSFSNYCPNCGAKMDGKDGE